MGSRIMHLIIANQIADRLSVEDKASFVIGGIVPDAVTPKEKSHFFKGRLIDYTRYIDYEGFLEQYHTNSKDSYILGYFAHLIADDLWLQGFYLPWLKNRIEANQELLHSYHNDFQLLNGKLLEYYACTDELREILTCTPHIFDLHEVSAKEAEAIIPVVLDDMTYDQEAVEKELNVFTFNQMIGYIETSIQKGLLHIKAIRSVSG